MRLLDRIELEHCAHAGRENGYLTVTYDQFVEVGIGRRFIKPAIQDAMQLGLLEVYPRLYRGGARCRPNLYRLTYLRAKFVPAAGAPHYLEPTHDWRHFRPEKKARKSSRMVTTDEPSRITTGEPCWGVGKRLAITNFADFTARHRK